MIRCDDPWKLDMQSQVRNTVEEEKAISPAKKVTETFIKHPHFQRVLGEIADIVADPDDSQQSLCILGYGRTGKSTICKKLKQMFPDRKDGVTFEHPMLGTIISDEIPIVLVEIPQEPSAAQMGRLVLQSMGDPNWFRGPRQNVEHRLGIYTECCKPKVFIFDEAHNIVDRSGTAAMEGVVDWLKWFNNKTQKPQVLFGLHRTEFLFKNNEQLRWRFGAPITLDAYPWEPDESGESHFFGLLYAFQAELPIPSEVDFCNEKNARRFYYASSGIIGLLKKLIWRAVKIVAANGSNGAITLDVLATAFKREIWSVYDGKVINPFSTTYRGEAPPPLRTDSLTGVTRRTRRKLKADALEMLSKR